MLPTHHTYISSEGLLRALEKLDPRLSWSVDLTASRWRESDPLTLTVRIAAFDMSSFSRATGHSTMVVFALIDGFGGDIAPIREQLAGDRRCKCAGCRAARKAEAA